MTVQEFVDMMDNYGVEVWVFPCGEHRLFDGVEYYQASEEIKQKKVHHFNIGSMYDKAYCDIYYCI